MTTSNLVEAINKGGFTGFQKYLSKQTDTTELDRLMEPIIVRVNESAVSKAMLFVDRDEQAKFEAYMLMLWRYADNKFENTVGPQEYVASGAKLLRQRFQHVHQLTAANGSQLFLLNMTRYHPNVDHSKLFFRMFEETVTQRQENNQPVMTLATIRKELGYDKT